MITERDRNLVMIKESSAEIVCTIFYDTAFDVVGELARPQACLIVLLVAVKTVTQNKPDAEDAENSGVLKDFLIHGDRFSLRPLRLLSFMLCDAFGADQGGRLVQMQHP